MGFADIREALRRAEYDRVRELLGVLGPNLHVNGDAAGGPASAVLDPALPTALARDGVGSLRVTTSTDPLVATIRAAVAMGLPPVFVYAFHETWTLGDVLRSAISRALETPYALIADAWAFHVVPGTAGWPPHRGISNARLDRAAPEVLNVWVALTDAFVDRSCIHAVPLDEDPAYPDELRSVAISSPRTFPVVTETALVWNANLLHWGGACAVDAPGPRISVTFTLVREDALDRFAWARVRTGELDLVASLDLIASQIATYGPGQPDVSPEILDWGRATCALRAAAHQ